MYCGLYRLLCKWHGKFCFFFFFFFLHFRINANVESTKPSCLLCFHANIYDIRTCTRLAWMSTSPFEQQQKKKNNYFNLLENKKRNISLVRTFNTSNYAIWFGARIIFDFYLSQVQENTNAAKITIHSFITFKWFWFKNSQWR